MQRPPLDPPGGGHKGRADLVTIATPTSATAAAAAGRAVLARARFIDRQRTALKILFMKQGNCLASIILRSHFDEGNPPRTAGGAILHDINCEHRTDLREIILQIVLGCCEG